MFFFLSYLKKVLSFFKGWSVDTILPPFRALFKRSFIVDFFSARLIIKAAKL